MNWELIIQRYKTNHRPRKEIEFDWFRQQPSFGDDLRQLVDEAIATK